MSTTRERKSCEDGLDPLHAMVNIVWLTFIDEIEQAGECETDEFMRVVREMVVTLM